MDRPAAPICRQMAKSVDQGWSCKDVLGAVVLRREVLPLKLNFLYQPQCSGAPIHEIIAGRNQLIRDLSSRVWLEEELESRAEASVDGTFHESAVFPKKDVCSSVLSPSKARSVRLCMCVNKSCCIMVDRHAPHHLEAYRFRMEAFRFRMVAQRRWFSLIHAQPLVQC